VSIASTNKNINTMKNRIVAQLLFLCKSLDLPANAHFASMILHVWTQWLMRLLIGYTWFASCRNTTGIKRCWGTPLIASTTAHSLSGTGTCRALCS
jgi:hypothetical protein